MASVSVLEEGSKTLKSFDSERIKRLYDKIYEDVFNSRASFLTDDDHLELLTGKKGISIYVVLNIYDRITSTSN